VPLKLEGSCQCGAVRFRVDSHAPYPYQLCYCSICRKTAGGGGYGINLLAVAASLEITGQSKHRRVHHATLRDEKGHGHVSSAERHFCGQCGSALWAYSPEWPELVHPQASAIDTPLPRPPERTHIMLGSKAAWVKPRLGRRDRRFDGYPEESIEAWHRRLGLWIP